MKQVQKNRANLLFDTHKQVLDASLTQTLKYEQFKVETVNAKCEHIYIRTTKSNVQEMSMFFWPKTLKTTLYCVFITHCQE